MCYSIIIIIECSVFTPARLIGKAKSHLSSTDKNLNGLNTKEMTIQDVI